MKFILRLLLFSVLVLTGKTAGSQLCSGSLGDPVVNITFGQGANPGPSLPVGVTNYGYVTTSCPQDGFYNIGTSTAACFNNTWHTVTEDHTPGDVNGYMMIVNASNNPGVFYVDTARGLCASTTYEFAAWILNVIKPSSCNFNTIRPDVTFNIETTSGTVLLTYNTNNIQPGGEPEWKQYGAFFTTPAGVSTVVIKMTNNATGGCGNDLLLDDITFRPCGPKVTGTVAGGTSTKDLCIGDNSAVNMTATASQADNNTFYQWQTSTNNGASWVDIQGANTTTYIRPPNAMVAATYLYRLAVAQGNNISLPGCRVVSNTITVTVNEPPVPAATNNGPGCVGENITLSASNGQTYNWNGPNGFSSTNQNPVLTAVQTSASGIYKVNVVSAKGCISSDSTLVTVRPPVSATAGSNVTICKGSSITLNGAGSGTTFSWTPAAGLSSANIPNPVATPDTTTIFTLTVSNSVCSTTAGVTVTVLPSPTANAGPDLKILQGQAIKLAAQATGGNVSVSWSPPVYLDNATTLQPVAAPVADITYRITVTSALGCGIATDDVFVRVFKSIKVPNAFSPNDDGINDVWQIEALDTYPEAELHIFNRYGQPILSLNGADAPWTGMYKGKLVPAGTYYYIIDLKNGMEKMSGSVTVFR